MRRFKHLSFTQRLQLEAYLKAKLPKKEIAKLLGVHISTVYREIKRGSYKRLNSKTYEFHMSYSPDISEKKYRDNLSCKGADLKIQKEFSFCKFLENLIINKKYSPSSALAEAKKHFDFTICVSTLYSYIYKCIFLELSSRHLTVKRKSKKSKSLAKNCPRGTSIEMRPIEVFNRSSFGHWEMDTVIGTKEKNKVLLVLTERYTRYEIIKLIKDKSSESVISALDTIENHFGSNRFKQLFKTITVDNGKEFSDFKGLEYSALTKSKRVSVYYCHPYSSYERGSNENANKLIRRHFPKGKSFSKLTNFKVEAVERWINNYPRKLLNWHSSAELFSACINSL